MQEEAAAKERRELQRQNAIDHEFNMKLRYSLPTAPASPPRASKLAFRASIVEHILGIRPVATATMVTGV
eukprot:SAG31_NODE_33277_length_345_cov_1.544715_1_plen_69_part_01